MTLASTWINPENIGLSESQTPGHLLSGSVSPNVHGGQVQRQTN
jgi:hypothetical protein